MCMRIVTFDFSLKYIFHFFLSVRRYLVVGSRYDFFFKEKTAYEIMPSLVGSEMCIRDSARSAGEGSEQRHEAPGKKYHM